MANSNTSIKIKSSGVSGNVPTSLLHGELAINYADGKIYYLDSNDTISFIQTSGGNNDIAIAAFETANAAFTSSNNRVLKTGDTMIGTLYVPDVNVSNTIITKDAQVTGNIQISNTLYFADTTSSNVFQMQYNATTNSLDFIFP